MGTQLDLAALDKCLQGLRHLFVDIQRLRPEVGYEEKRGGYGDVQVSKLDPESSDSKLVAAKTRLARELKVWAGLRHPHVLALLGFYLDEDYKIAVLISEYMIHGDLKDYIEQDEPDWDKRLSLGNVLVSATRRAILADFGLSKALEEGPTGLTTSEGLKGTLRYYSPEVLADRIPYAEKKSEHSIILALMNNEPPSDTATLPIPISALKDLINKCWTIDPNQRPSAEDCLKILNTEASSVSMTLSGAITTQLVNPPQTPSSNPPYPHSAVATSQPTTQLPQPSSILLPVPSRSTIQSIHGAWRDEETERLKNLVEQSKSRTPNGEIDWDWTVEQFGETRKRHQILIKATSLALKPTSTHPSRLRKRLSMQNTQEQTTISSALASLAQASVAPDAVREDHHLPQGGSGNQSRGSDPSARLGQPAGFASSEGHFYAPNPPTPSASVSSTATLRPHDQHGQQSNLARQHYIDLGSASNTLQNPKYFSSNQGDPANNPTRPLNESAQNSQQARSVPSSQHVHFSEFFTAEFHSWLKPRGAPPQPLRFCGKDVALHRLFLWVGVLGGWRIVTDKKLWPAVGAKIQFLDITNQSLFPEPELADQLLKYYEKVLANFEIHWNNLFRACDPNATFPLPSHLRYLRPEIERFAYDLLPVLLQQPRSLEVENFQLSVNGRVSTNTGAPEPKGEDLLRCPGNDIILKGTQDSRNLRTDIVEVRKERGLMLLQQRLTKAQQVAERIASTQEKTSQNLPGDRVAPGLRATEQSGIDAAGVPQAQDIFSQPSDTRLPDGILLSWPSLNIPPHRLLKTQEKVQSNLEFYRQKAYHLVTLSQEQGVLLERNIQQARTVLQQVSQNIVQFFAVVDDEHDLGRVAEAVMALLRQDQILHQYPLKKQFILGLDDFTEYKNRLSLFLMRVQGLQNPGSACQHQHTPRTQNLGLPFPDFRISESFSTTHVPGVIAPITETLQPSAGTAESSKLPPGPSTFHLPPKTSSRKRDLEAYATVLEDYSNLSDPCKRPRTVSHVPVDAQGAEESDILS
ncbi:hypothetical protein FRC01_011860 [Tulasnella sp. 417]|nr:hypothetical protein FRC01_011860 [Tulasnella sp. 417]